MSAARGRLPSLLQTSARVAHRAAHLFPPTVVAQLAQMEKELGGRAALVGLLTLAPLTADLRYLLGVLGDPASEGQSLAELCALANVLPSDLCTQLTAAARRVGQVHAAQVVAAGTRAVVEDIMRRAAPYEDSCTGCQGVGSRTAEPTAAQPNPSPEPCPTCRGIGRLLFTPDLERQKLAVELAQLLPKGGGLNIALQQNNGPAPSSGGMGLGPLEKMDALLDQLLYERQGEGAAGPAQEMQPEVEGEVVEPLGDRPPETP